MRFTKRVVILAMVLVPNAVIAQTSSIGASTRKQQRESPRPVIAREAPARPRNAVYERHAWVTMTPKPPKVYRPGDLLTIIIRENKRWEAEADLSTKKKWNIKSEIAAMLKMTDGGLAPTTFKRGIPNIDYDFESQMRSDGDTSREDSLTTRLTASIIDVKPNGILVIEGRARLVHDEEISEVTVVGYCRKQDVTADNTVLSTQIAGKEVKITNEGAMRAAATRGWIPRMIDLLKPI